MEAAIFNSRWLLAPFYFGLVISLLVLLLKFLRILYDFVTHAWGASESDIILGVLSLIDVTLTANLVLIVVFSGYENFVSRIDPADHPDWPEWMRHIDFSGLKQKVLASIVAISAVQVLKAYKPRCQPEYRKARLARWDSFGVCNLDLTTRLVGSD